MEEKMSKKILVIKDWGKFCEGLVERWVGGSDLDRTWIADSAGFRKRMLELMNDTVEMFKQYELKDAIQLEAEVKVQEYADKVGVRLLRFIEVPPDPLWEGNKVTCFIFRKEE